MRTPYKVIVCPICKVRRHTYKLPSEFLGGKTYKVWKCSKEHIWKSLVVGLTEANELLAKFYLAPIKAMFAGDSVLYSRRKK